MNHYIIINVKGKKRKKRNLLSAIQTDHDINNNYILYN